MIKAPVSGFFNKIQEFTQKIYHRSSALRHLIFIDTILMCSLVIALVIGWFFVTQLSVYVMGGLWLLDTLFCITEIRDDDSELFRNSISVYNEANNRNILLMDRYSDVLMREKEERV